MDETRTFVCPHCRATLEAAAGSEGASLACPSCGKQLTVPAQDAAPAAQSPSVVCPVCKSPWQRGAVLCVACGFDARTGKRLRTTMKAARGRPLFASRRTPQSTPYVTTETLVTVIVIAAIIAFAWHRAVQRKERLAAEAAADRERLVQSSQQSQILGQAIEEAARTLASPTNSAAFARLKEAAEANTFATNRTEAFALLTKYARQESRVQQARDKELSLALDNAIRDGQIDAVDRLLEQGAPINGFGSLTPVLRAHAEGHADVVAHLLDKGADPQPLLALAGRYPGSLDALDLLAQRGVAVTNCSILESFAKDITGKRGERLLCSFALLEHLLDKGASPAATNALGQTALHLLAQVHRGLVQVEDNAVSGQRGILAAAEALLEKGCDPELLAVPPPGAEPAYRPWEPRAEKGRPAPSRKGAAERWSALDYAAVRGDTQLVDLLLRHSVARGLKPQDVARRAVLLVSRRDTPCYDFAPCEYSEEDSEPTTLEATMAERLVEKGADPNARDAAGATCLHEAVANGSERTCRALLKAGADPNAQTENGWSPLHVAVASGHAEMAKLLLDADVRVDAQDADGATSLHLAVRAANGSLRDALLEKGASVALADKRGMAALHVAAEASDWESARRLLDRKADVNARDGKGRTPVLIAAQNMKSDVSMLVAGLIHAGADVTLKDLAGRDVAEVMTSHADKAVRDVGYTFLQGGAQDYVAFVRKKLEEAKAAEAKAAEAKAAEAPAKK